MNSHLSAGDRFLLLRSDPKNTTYEDVVDIVKEIVHEPNTTPYGKVCLIENVVRKYAKTWTDETGQWIEQK